MATLDDPSECDAWKYRDYLYPAEAIVGWRFWWIVRQENDWFIDYAYTRPGKDGTVTYSAVPARCEKTRHAYVRKALAYNGDRRGTLQRWEGVDEHYAPHPDCTCGIHVVRQLDDLAAYIRWMGRAAVGRMGTMVVTRCTGYGRFAHGWEELRDPPGTFRVERCDIGPVILPHTTHPMWVERLSQHLDVLGTARLQDLRTSA
ncbi:hypothetical protein [Nocardia cyriacigeorgica]|uniref:hypothetical protein n=1 Tax=Nocardia cyriacigeorgica TaxID=135487 RepID=UPI00248F6AA6|nr:hypothetical protein [Nocardia cyriacigeorgica]